MTTHHYLYHIAFSYSWSQVSALQAEIKSVQKNLKECTENEQSALAECRTLQEAVKDKKELQTMLQKKETDITALETEVTFIFHFF